MKLKIGDIVVFITLALTIVSISAIYTPTMAEWVAYGVCGLVAFVGYICIRSITSTMNVTPQKIALRRVILHSTIGGFVVSIGFVIVNHIGETPILEDGVLYVSLAVVLSYLAIRTVLIKEGTKTQMVIDDKNVHIIHVGIENKKNLLRKVKTLKDEIESSLICEPQQKRLILSKISSLYDNISSIPPNLIENNMPLKNVLREIEEKIDACKESIDTIQEQISIFNDYNNRIYCLI